MSTLDSSSTLAEVQAAYDDNASYAEDDSTAKAAAFVTACRFLLRRLPRRAAHGGRGAEEVELELRLIREELNAASQWLAVKGATGGGIKHVSFENFRS